MFLLAHLSDLHATRPEPAGLAELLGKRGLSWLSWRSRRRQDHRREILEAVLAHLAERAASHVAVTGDLTHLGLPGEIAEAERWLRRIGPPERVSAVPGNHDTLVGPRDAAEVLWEAYTSGRPEEGAAPAASRFPAVRLRGPLAIVGLSSARPTAPLLATGRLGVAQCEALEARLHALREEGRVRVVLVHHTPTPGESPRRRLVDAPALRRVLARAGAELVLHGHAHRAVFASLPGPEGPIPVVGAPSASAPSPKDASRRAGYHLFAIEPGQGVGAPARIEATTWSLDPASGTFRAAHRSLAPSRRPTTPRRRAG